ncbi:MAG: DeoR/GlpR family DNA-binding transcription regulator [Candidatus Devosia euplotis]|nr:DeoR/GlpR family DNA-binding transcription regulator [Candidatus Devosia euplotis]
MTDSANQSADRARSARRPRSDAPKVNLLAEPRRMKILEWLQEEGSARVRDLAAAFGVSEATVRQDLESLEIDGHVTREHGGAFLKSVPAHVQSMSLQRMENIDSKRSIGLMAASMVHNYQSIIIDSGSTTTTLANNLVSRQGLNVVTNALNIALLLGSNPTNTVHMPAGQFKAPTLSLSGEKSGEFFEGIFVETLFLATAGISFEAGLTYPALGDIYVKKAMIKAASKVVLLADSSKIGRTSFSSLGPVDLVHTLITDSDINSADRARFEALGIAVMIAN